MPSESSQLPLTFIGALPPPVTGRTAMTAAVYEALKARTPVRCFNWSRGKTISGWRWKLARVWGATKSLIGLMTAGRARGARLYYSVSSGAGLYYDLLIAALARLLGYRLALHHHTYLYINRHDWRVALLDRFAGSTGAHIVHCDLMRRDFLRRYKSRAEFLFVPPTIVSQQLECVEPAARSDFTLGFLSNLTLEKGVDEAIETFDRLAKAGRKVRFILAGPCMGPKERALVDGVVARWPTLVEYRGPLYGADKARFFADIDAFIFPTRNESWGIVLTEALQAGRPVISRSLGCVPWIVREGCGLTVDPNADFPAVASERINAWIEQPESYASARADAQRRSTELNAEARLALPELVERLLATAGHDR